MPRPATPGEQLMRLVPDVDRLVRDANAGPLPAHEYNRLEGEVDRICTAMRAAFRGRGNRQ